MPALIPSYPSFGVGLDRRHDLESVRRILDHVLVIRQDHLALEHGHDEAFHVETEGVFRLVVVIEL